MTLTPNITQPSCFGVEDGSISIDVIGGFPPYTYDWGSDLSGTSSISDIGAGQYSVVVKDNKDCEASLSVTVSEPVPLSANASSQNAGCQTCDNGSASVSATGGTSPYSYAWSNGSTGSSATGLLPGNYSVVVTDANGCTEEAEVEVGKEPCYLALTPSASNPKCFGGNDGSVGVTVSGNGGTYTYAWSTGAASSSVSGLPSGIYTVTVTNDLRCSRVASVSINDPEPIIITLEVTKISEQGAEDGSITANVSGGTGNYTYAWSDGSNGTSISDLAPNTYSVVVTDDNGCSGSASATINPFVCPAITLSGQVQNPMCFGEENGSISVTVSGGDPPYTYSWSDGSTASSLGNLGAGTYSLTVKDDKNCEVIASYTITNPPILETNTSSTNTACPICSTGTASASAGGGTPPYSYEWGNNEEGSSIGELPVGTYSVNVTDANGCTNSTTVDVQADPCDISVDLSPTNPTCPNASNGSISAIPSGNGTSYTYSWSTGSGEESISGLRAGAYSVEVTNNYGCKASASTSLSDPNPLSIRLDVQDVSTRNRSDGSIAALVSGGTGNFTYLWSDEAASTGSSISGLAPGEYTVLVTDTNGCEQSASATVKDYVCPDLMLSASVANPACYGETGSITANASKGTSPYSYQWDGGPASATYGGITAGLYGVVVTDSKGCKASGSFELKEPAKLTANMGSKDVSMVGGMDGEAWVNAKGGSPNYTYSWNVSGSGSNIIDLGVGSYSVTVIDNNGCKAYGTTNVNEPNCNLTVNIAKTDISCHGLEDGSASVYTSTNNDYSYVWTPGGYTSSSIDNLAAGSYSVQVTDKATGCQASNTTTIEEPTQIRVSLEITDPTNAAGDNGSITASAAGGTPPYIFDWGDDGTGSTIVGLSAGSYTVNVIDSRDCSQSKVGVIDHCNVSVSLSVNYNDCPNENVTITANATGGSSNYRYIWPGDYEPTTNSSTSGVRGETYCVTVIDIEDESCTVTGCITPLGCAQDIVDGDIENRGLYINPVFLKKAPTIQIYPNPFNDLLHIDIETQQSQELEVVIVDLMGRVIYRQLVDTQVGMNQLTIDMATTKAANGLYQVLIKGKDTAPQNFKVVRMRQ